MNFEEAYPILRLFIEKAERLEGSRFLKEIKEDLRLGFTFIAGKEIQVRSKKPDNEAIDAFILTFRFFIQDNEAISLRNLKKIIDSNLVTKDEKDFFQRARKTIESFLKESSNLILKEHELSNGEILDTILYGELSHANTHKKIKYNSWMDTMPLFREAIWHKFIICVVIITTQIIIIKGLLEKIIKREGKEVKQLFYSYDSTYYGKVNCYF